MDIARTNSLYIDGVQAEGPNNSDTAIKQPNAVRTEYGKSLVLSKRSRIPTFMKNSNKSGETERNQKKMEEVNQIKQSKLGSRFRSQIKNFRKIINCKICDLQMKKNDKQLFMANCEHKLDFCESCLHSYAIYKIRNFEQVRCPNDECQATLDIETQFFKQLPADIQKNYRKIQQFSQITKDSNTKLCPKQNCQGLIRTTVENIMVCNKCQSSFCAKCLLALHEGDCDSHEILFFQSNLHYRQCKKCKFVIEKNQGCNHMTCRCGYQFCYVCGVDWNPAHYGNHNQNGQLIAVPNNPALVIQQDRCCQCCDDTCGGYSCLFKAPLKLFLLILFFILMIIIFISRDLLVMTGVSLMCIFAGLFGFSFEMLSELEGCTCLLGVIFFPVLMILGIGMAFKEIFCDVVPNLCQEYWQMFCEGSSDICQM